MAEIFVYVSNSLVHLKHILIDFQNQKIILFEFINGLSCFYVKTHHFYLYNPYAFISPK